MGIRDLLSLPWKPRRMRSRARSESAATDVPSEVDLAALPHSETDLGIGSSSLSTSVPSTSRNQNSNDNAVFDPTRDTTREGERLKFRDRIFGRSAATSEKKSKSNWNTAYAATKVVIDVVKESADACAPLKSVMGCLAVVLKHYDQTAANYKTIESLIPRVEGLVDLLQVRVTVPESEVNERERRETLKRQLEDILDELEPLAGQGKVEGFFSNVENLDKLGGLAEDIRDAMMDYQTSLQQDIYDKNCLLIESADLAVLERMYHASDAGYRCGNRQGCLRGTRKDVLRDIEYWLTDEREQQVFWLNGLAGTGKSTIAQTFAETAFANGKLGASFFCSRDFEDRSNLRAIFPTLAFQLAYQHLPLRKELLRILRARPDVGRESLCSQMEKLIVGPLKAVGIPTLIIIDALDECNDEEPASAMLSILSRYVSKIPKVKFFITGRPEPRIRSGFRLESLIQITEVLKLHEVKPEAVNNDIGLFFRTQLTNLARNRSDCDLMGDWPSQSDIKILCEKAAGFFIYASTVIKFIASDIDPPSERLSIITSLPQSTMEEGKSGVDQLYIKVLEQTLCDVRADNSQGYSRFRTVVGTILLIFNPLSIEGLSELLGQPNIRSTLRPLYSLLLVPDSNKDPILTFHKSFPDFLMDSERCKDNRFFVEPTVHHAGVLLSCLNLMRERLKRNICNLDDHAVLSEVKDLSARQKDHIGDALEYACHFWTKHLLRVPDHSSQVEEVQKEIDGFFMTHLLHWIEVLALTGNLGVGVHAIKDIEQWYTSIGALCKWTMDSQRLILEHFDAIHDSPSHIYCYAIPFSPSSSWLHQSYTAEHLQGVKVVTGLPAEWGICSRTAVFGHMVLALAHWKGTIAVGFGFCDIVILDAITGSQTAVLSGHTSWVKSLAFSSDGTLLVSGSYDKTINLWDIQTGGVIKTFSGHTDHVLSVSISLDSTMIASGSSDKTICLWNIQMGNCCHVIKQHRAVTYVKFSPIDPHHLISVSGDKIQQWGVDGHKIGPTYDGSHIAFSLNGNQFASCHGAAVVVRNTSSNKITTKFHGTSGNFRCCCFSPDGKSIAVAAGRNIYIWDITGSEPHLVETFVGHTGDISSLAFSSSLISASMDLSIKFWQIGSMLTDPAAIDPKPTSLTSTAIKFVTLQAKDGVAASGLDGIVKIWDILTGLCIASFQTPTKGSCPRVAQLIHGSFIVVWWEDDKIHVWDTRESRLLQTVNAPGHEVKDIRISGDGSTVFYLDKTSIQAQSISTEGVTGKVGFGGLRPGGSLTTDGLRVWVCFPGIDPKGWDFGIPGSSPVPLSKIPLPRYHLGSKEQKHPSGIITDTVTGKKVLQLHGRFANPVDSCGDGQYLVAGYQSGDVLILDFNHVSQ